MKIQNPFLRGAAIGVIVLSALVLYRLNAAPLAPTRAENVNAPLRCQTIFDEFNARSTELQRFQYIETLTGRSFVCDGTVTNVTSDGVVYVAPFQSLVSVVALQSVILRDVPGPDAARLNSGDRVSFEATARRRSGNIGLYLESDFTGWRDTAALLKQR